MVPRHLGPCKSDRIFFSSGEYLIAKSSTRLDLYNRRSDFSVRVYFFFGPIYKGLNGTMVPVMWKCTVYCTCREKEGERSK